MNTVKHDKEDEIKDDWFQLRRATRMTPMLCGLPKHLLQQFCFCSILEKKTAS